MRLRWLLAMLGAGVLGCGPGGPPSVRVDPALATLVPGDTQLLIGVRVDHLRDTPFYGKYVKSGRIRTFGEQLDRTGVSPDDLWEILLAANGSEAVVMARGRFSDSGMEPRLEWDGSRRTSYKGYILIEDGIHGVMFMNASTVLAGPPELLRRIIDQRGRNHRPPRKLLDLVKHVDPSNQVWAVAAGYRPVYKPNPGFPGARNADNILRKLDSITAGINLSNGLALEAEGHCATAADASLLRDTLRALVSLGTFGVRRNPSLEALLGTIAIEARENVLQLDAAVPPDLLDELIGQNLP